MEQCISLQPAHEKGNPGVLGALEKQLRLFAGVQIRNVATVAGNIVTASPISDLNPVWVAANADFQLQSLSGTRTVAAKDFFLGYRFDAAPRLYFSLENCAKHRSWIQQRGKSYTRSMHHCFRFLTRDLEYQQEQQLRMLLLRPFTVFSYPAQTQLSVQKGRHKAR